MKRLFKKNQIIITTLAIMIAIAGYLNYSGRILREKSKEASSDDNTVLLTDEAPQAVNTYTDSYEDIVSLDGDGSESAYAKPDEGSTVGEAVLASSTGTNLLAAARLNREQVRAKSRENLQAIIDNAQITENEKAEAVSAMTTMEEVAQKEAAAELLLEAKGYEDCVVSIADGEADVVVNEASLDEAQRAQIEDIVKRKTDISGEHIVITPGAAQS